MNEMRRMQARLDRFMRTHPNRNNRQEQPRVRTREGRPVCDICGRMGHVIQNCYARVDQRNQYQNPQNTQPHTQTGPRIAALEAAGTAEPIVAQFNQPNHQQKEHEAQSEGVYYARRSNPPIFGHTEVQPINYNSVKKKEAPACDILKTEFIEPTPNSKRQCHSDKTHSTFHPQQSQEKATEPETYTDFKPNSSEKVIVMTTSNKENLRETNAKQHIATLQQWQKTKCAFYQVMNATRLQTTLFSPHQIRSQLTSDRSYRVQIKRPKHTQTQTEIHKGLQSIRRSNPHSVVFHQIHRNGPPLSLVK